MKLLRRILGILVMIAGILGLILSVAGLVAVWMVKPTIIQTVSSTINALNVSLDASQNAMEIASETLSAAVVSVDALSEMLANTATTVEETQPVVAGLNTVIGETLPSSLESASQSLVTAQQAAVVLDGTIKSLDNFRMVLSATPFLGSLVEPGEAYNPEVPLADSLGELAATLEDLPGTFTQMSDDIDKADDNLVTIQTNLNTMSESVRLISQSLTEYEDMVAQSKSSMENIKDILTTFQENLYKILNGAVIVMSLFLFWLLAAQIVILSQGWELYQGTTDRMEGGKAKPGKAEAPSGVSTTVEPIDVESPTEH